MSACIAVARRNDFPPRTVASVDQGRRTAVTSIRQSVREPGPNLSEAATHRLLIADDHPLFRGALREAVSGLFDRVEIGEAGTFEEVTGLLERGGEIDLVLLDLRMPGARGFSGLMYLRAQYPSLPIIVVSANDDPAVIRRCMEFGASGFIPKTLGIEVLREAIARVLQGEVWTPPDVDLARGADAETAAMIARLVNADAAAGAGADDAVGRLAQ